MATPEAIAQSDAHRANCRRIAQTSQIQDIREIAAALEDSNKWLDAYHLDIQKLFDQISEVRELIEEISP
jgi:hypothetical protein